MNENIKEILYQASKHNVVFTEDFTCYNEEQLLIVFAAELKGIKGFYPDNTDSAEEMDISLAEMMSIRGITFSDEENAIIREVSPYYKALGDIIKHLSGFSELAYETNAKVKASQETE